MIQPKIKIKYKTKTGEWKWDVQFSRKARYSDRCGSRDECVAAVTTLIGASLTGYAGAHIYGQLIDPVNA